MPPLQDITTSVLRENNLRENILQQQDEIEENEFLRTLDENNLVIPSTENTNSRIAITQNRRQVSRSRSLPGSSISSISPPSRSRRSCHQFSSLSSSSNSTSIILTEDFMSKKFDLMCLSNSMSSLDDEVFDDCCCHINNKIPEKKKVVSSKRRHSMPSRKANLEITPVKIRNKKVNVYIFYIYSLCLIIY